MLTRYATLALLISALGAHPVSAQTASKMNYLGQIIDLTELIPPPPPPDSEAWKEDLASVLEMLMIISESPKSPIDNATMPKPSLSCGYPNVKR